MDLTKINYIKRTYVVTRCSKLNTNKAVELIWNNYNVCFHYIVNVCYYLFIYYIIYSFLKSYAIFRPISSYFRSMSKQNLYNVQNWIWQNSANGFVQRPATRFCGPWFDCIKSTKKILPLGEFLARFSLDFACLDLWSNPSRLPILFKIAEEQYGDELVKRVTIDYMDVIE